MLIRIEKALNGQFEDFIDTWQLYNDFHLLTHRINEFYSNIKYECLGIHEEMNKFIDEVLLVKESDLGILFESDKYQFLNKDKTDTEIEISEAYDQFQKDKFKLQKIKIDQIDNLESFEFYQYGSRKLFTVENLTYTSRDRYNHGYE